MKYHRGGFRVGYVSNPHLEKQQYKKKIERLSVTSYCQLQFSMKSCESQNYDFFFLGGGGGGHVSLILQPKGTSYFLHPLRNPVSAPVLNFGKRKCWYWPIACRSFSPKMHFWTFWRFSGWIWTKLAPNIYSKRYLQHDSTPFFPLELLFMTFLLEHAQKSKFDLYLLL